jgi:hypothetical protein
MDFVVEFVEVDERDVTVETYVGKTGLVALLYQVIHHLQCDPDLLINCEAGGLNIRRIYEEGD